MCVCVCVRERERLSQQQPLLFPPQSSHGACLTRCAPPSHCITLIVAWLRSGMPALSPRCAAINANGGVMASADSIASGHNIRSWVFVWFALGATCQCQSLSVDHLTICRCLISDIMVNDLTPPPQSLQIHCIFFRETGNAHKWQKLNREVRD